MVTTEQLHANRKCPFGGGCKDCACNGNCVYSRVQNPREPSCECGLSRDQCNHPVCTTGIINASRDANQ